MKRLKLFDSPYFQPKQLPLSILLYLTGIVVMPFGVVLTINSHAGAGGYDALNFALGERLGIKTSYAIYLTAFLAVLVTAAVRKGFPRLLTFVSSLFLGVSTDFWKKILAGLQGNSDWMCILLLASGMIFVGIGVAGYMLSGFPTNPTDDMIVALREKKVSIQVAKIGFDALCFVLALILGGEVGWGTVVITLGLGPVIQFWYNLFNRWCKRA